VKVAINVPADFSIWTFHRGLIEALQQRNIDVTVVGPDGEYVEAIRGLGPEYHTVKLARFFNPFKDLGLLWSYYRYFRQEKFDIVHNHTIKPNIYGTIGAKMAGIPTILASVRGMGSVFTEVPGLKRKLIKFAVMKLYTLAFLFVDRVQFLNPDDLEFFVSSGMIRRDKTALIRSSGVNLREYDATAVSAETLAALRQEFGIDTSTLVVAMVARAYWSKGVHEFVTAAEALGATYNAVFLLLGSTETGPDAVPESYLREHESEVFRWPGYRKDVRDLLTLADVVALPSYYPEGVPRSLLEAMAIGKPIITTGAPGCREVIEHEKNGLMVPIKDAQALTDAVETLLKDEQKRAEYGRYSRQKVEQEFDEKLVVGKVVSDLYRL
jgi:glycosyltransferase involved in cell wall biosynthesis